MQAAQTAQLAHHAQHTASDNPGTKHYLDMRSIVWPEMRLPCSFFRLEEQSGVAVERVQQRERDEGGKYL